MAVGPKSVRVQSSPQYLFTLWGSGCIKAAHRMLMKLRPCFYTLSRIDPGRMDRVFISVIVFSVQVANKLELEYK